MNVNYKLIASVQLVLLVGLAVAGYQRYRLAAPVKAEAPVCAPTPVARLQAPRTAVRCPVPENPSADAHSTITNVTLAAQKYSRWSESEFTAYQQQKVDIPYVEARDLKAFSQYLSEGDIHKIRTSLTGAVNRYRLYVIKGKTRDSYLIETDSPEPGMEHEYIPYHVMFIVNNSVTRVYNLRSFIFMYETGALVDVTDMNGDGDPELWLQGNICECDGSEPGDECKCDGIIVAEVVDGAAFVRGQIDYL